MRTRWKKPSRCSGEAALVLIASLALSFWCTLPLAPGFDFRARAGEIVDATTTTSIANGLTSIEATLMSSTGLEVRLRCTRTTSVDGARPAALIIGGLRTGSDGVDVAGDPSGIAIAAIDYPYAGPEKLKGALEILRALPVVRKALLDTPAAALLANDWLRTQSYIDSDRIELVGASLGTPFAIAAAGADARFKRLWILQGGIDYPRWFGAALEREVASPRLRSAITWGALRYVGAHAFDPAHWLGQLASRPLVVIASRADARVPNACTGALVEAARSAGVATEIEWVDVPHIERSRTDVARTLLDLVRPRIERGD